MKLLVLAPQPFFQNRGTPIATMKMLHVLSDEGHEIDLLTYHEGNPIAIRNCRHLRILQLPLVRNIPPGFSIRKLICDFFMTIHVLWLCLQNEYDVIHAVEESVFMAMLVKHLTGIPYIYDMDSSLPRQITDHMPVLRVVSPLLRRCEQLAVCNSQGVVAVCQSLEEVAAAHCHDVPIVRIEDASLLTKASDVPEKSSTELGISGPVLMYVGNLQTYQGIDLLLDTFTHIYHQNDVAKLVVIGGSTREVRRYRNVAKRYGIDSRTHFLGPRPVSQLGDYLEQADILISPRTLGSNTPMKIFSYLESGTPVVATALSMHTQVLDTEICLLAEATPLDMAQGVLSLLADKALRERLSQAAQRRIRQRFRAEVLDSKLSEFYQELALNLGCEASPAR